MERQKPELTTLERQLSDLDAWIAEIGDRLAFLKNALGPFHAEDRKIRNRIARTHISVDDEDGNSLVIGWLRCNRALMYNALDRVNSEYAPYKREQKEKNWMMRSAVKERDKLKDRMEREERRMKNKRQLELI